MADGSGVGEAPSELYANLFGKSDQPAQSTPVPSAPAPAPQLVRRIAAPKAPLGLQDSGLNMAQVCDLILKQLYLQNSLLGIEIARNARLPFPVLDDALRFLKDEKCVEVSSGELIGRASYRFQLTEMGRVRAREAFEQCRYVGPAPVTLSSYVAQCRAQTAHGAVCTPQALSDGFQHLVIRPNLLQELGPAICSGKSVFLYGPPGNGKSVIAKGLGNFLNTQGGDIYVPYAVQTENNLITVFDPSIHQTTDDAELRAANGSDELAGLSSRAGAQSSSLGPDLRWRRIRRPVVITGGELMLEMLELRYSKTSNYYQAPLHIKANGGVFLIDDFGRQIVSPRDLLNRWILPLEERIDYLTLATGKKFAVPFEQLIIFSTNLDPRELVDEAFLRRIRHKIKIGPPDRDLFTEIFKRHCQAKSIPYRQDSVDFLFENFYDRGKPPRCSDARDLLEIVQSICRFRSQRVVLTRELISEATARFFCQV
ncbi:MAG: ATPase [Planctomycetaceae bacterium]|nr:ATPase [Planctomycetaceae bacterium]